MLLMTADERRLAEAVSILVYCNPFLPERIEAERRALGDEFNESEPVWTIGEQPGIERPNVIVLSERAGALADALRNRLAEGHPADGAELKLYVDLVLYCLYYGQVEDFRRMIEGALAAGHSPKRIPFYRDYARQFERYFHLPGRTWPTEYDPAHLFACFYQIRRAFHHIFTCIVGASLPVAMLRAAVWQSTFTHDVERFRRVLYDKMGDITTLVTGPSGTGKELVARAIALSRYIPFDAETLCFAGDFVDAFHPVNLSALTPTLIESEMFGHRRGAFTGALEDRVGRLEACGPLGTVFLDEIGDTDPAIQVKLLRVLQTRSFERIGDTAPRRFEGKIIAATHRDLAAEMRSGRFRNDLYYRLCADIIVTPSLHEQLQASRGGLRSQILFIAQRFAGDAAGELAEEAELWINEHLGPDYAWPGNFRELEQCVRNVLIRKEYVPPTAEPTDARRGMAREFLRGSLTADDLLARYCTLVYAQTGNYSETARRLALDRRTVQKYMDEELLGDLKGQTG